MQTAFNEFSSHKIAVSGVLLSVAAASRESWRLPLQSHRGTFLLTWNCANYKQQKRTGRW